MNRFEVSPNDCLVVHAIARCSSLREAASFLRIDPATMARKVQKITTKHELLQKIKGRWIPTEKGRRMAQWVEEGVLLQNELLNERPCVRIATTMWMAEQILIPGMDDLAQRCDQRYSWQIRTPTLKFEEDLQSGLSDFVIACHPPDDPAITHKRVAHEKWLAVAPKNWSKGLQGLSNSELREALKVRPFVRHINVNPEAFLKFTPTTFADFCTDNLIGVRTGVESAKGWSCIPEILVRKALASGDVIRLDLEVACEGHVCVWWPRSRQETKAISKHVVQWLSQSIT